MLLKCLFSPSFKYLAIAFKMNYVLLSFTYLQTLYLNLF